ncbi:MAG: hypothetical protein G01um101444_457, partial [Parcubacteria group bacterium Gr01-1014_44]
NLVLANREARFYAPSGEDLSGGNAWAALCAATEMDGKFEKSLIMERVKGIEPSYSDWQPDALPLCYTRNFMPEVGIEPTTNPSSGECSPTELLRRFSAKASPMLFPGKCSKN